MLICTHTHMSPSSSSSLWFSSCCALWAILGDDGREPRAPRGRRLRRFGRIFVGLGHGRSECPLGRRGQRDRFAAVSLAASGAARVAQPQAAGHRVHDPRSLKLFLRFSGLVSFPPWGESPFISLLPLSQEMTTVWPSPSA